MADIDRSAYDVLQGVNFSTLKELKKSARHYLQALEEKREPTDALEIGIATHLAVFEPVRFVEEIAVWPEGWGSRRGKRWDAFQAEADAKRHLVLREQDHGLVEQLATAVHESPQAQKYLRLHGDAEVTLQWVDSKTGVKCKGRIDWRCEAGIVDLKAVKDASPEGFGRAAHTYSWPLQAAWYSRGDRETSQGLVRPFIFLAVEKKPPFVVQAYRVSDEVLEYGEAEADELLAKLVELRKTWKERRGWPGYSAAEMDLELPRWAWPADGEASIELMDEDEQAQADGHAREDEQ